MDLKGAVAVITGASRGIGKAIAVELALKGCKVVIASRSTEQLNSVLTEIHKQGGEAIAVTVDLSKKGESKKIISAALEVYGTVDILINNAAVLKSEQFMDFTEDDWEMTLSVNLIAPFMISKDALSIMAGKKKGYIINISSTAALEVPPELVTYGTSKKALIGFSEALYAEAKKNNVKVSVIYPGMTDTEMLRGFNPPVNPGFWMQPEDIVGCIIFLLQQSERVIIRDIVPWAAKHDQI